MGSIVFIDFLNKLPPNNAVAVAGMLNQLYETSEDDIGFIEDFILHGSPIPNNIVKNINRHLKKLAFHNLLGKIAEQTPGINVLITGLMKFNQKKG